MLIRTLVTVIVFACKTVTNVTDELLVMHSNGKQYLCHEVCMTLINI